jgi:phosphopantetheinyl transferase
VNSHLFIEKIGSEATLREGATAEDLAFVERISNSGRRCEVLAWRAIVRRELGADVEIFYDEYGAPKVDRPNTYIGVSHSKGVVAVYISEKPCAVDIEHSNRDFRRVASRYLSIEEQRLADGYDIFAEMWCAKEALYKYYKKGALDLVKDIVIEEYRLAEGSIVATILGGEPIEVSVRREDNIAIALI